MQVDVFNSKGEKTGRSVELPDDIFGIEPNDHCIYLAVKQYLAAQRQGTHKTKTRADVQFLRRTFNFCTGLYLVRTLALCALVLLYSQVNNMVVWLNTKDLIR